MTGKQIADAGRERGRRDERADGAALRDGDFRRRPAI